MYHYAANNPVKYVDPDGRWGKDVHFFKTFKWANESGFSLVESYIIALACNNVDNITKGKSFLPIIGDQSYHFDTNSSSNDSRLVHADIHLENAIELKNTANELRKTIKPKDMWIVDCLDKASLQELGICLHALQDSFAHDENYTRDYFDIMGKKIFGIKSHALEGKDGLEKGSSRPFADNADLRKDEIEATKKATKEYLQEYLDGIRG